MGLEFFASDVETDVASYWSDERCQDVHELYVNFVVGPEEPGHGLYLWREYNASGGPGRFAAEPMVAYTDREPTSGILQVHLTRGQIRVALRKREEVTARFNLEEEEFERIRTSLQELFADRSEYSERLER